MATVAQIVTACQVELQDPAGIYFDTPLVQGFVLEGLGKFAEATRCLRRTHTSTLTAADGVLDLSGITPGVHEVMRLWIAGRELEYLTGDQMADQPGYPEQAGAPCYYTREPVGFPAIRLHPKPADPVDVRLDYVATGYVVNGTTPAIPPEFHDALRFYALARLCGSDIPIAQQAKAQQYADLYRAEVERCSALVKAGFQRKPAGSQRHRHTEWF